jgi:hypothetical protein
VSAAPPVKRSVFGFGALGAICSASSADLRGSAVERIRCLDDLASTVDQDGVELFASVDRIGAAALQSLKAQALTPPGPVASTGGRV